MRHLLLIHIKICRGNFFFIISNKFGKILWIKTSGCLGYMNITKRSLDAFNRLMLLGIKFILRLQFKFYLFIRIEGTKKNILYRIRKKILKPLIKHQIKIIGLKALNKITHNGCRKK